MDIRRDGVRGFSPVQRARVSAEILQQLKSAILEGRLAQLAADRITEAELAQVQHHITRHAEAIEAGRLHATADLGFHRMVAEASKNPALVLEVQDRLRRLLPGDV